MRLHSHQSLVLCRTSGAPARALAIPEATQPAASIALSLKPRRLRDYVNPKLEWLFAVTSLLSFALLARYYVAAP